MGTTQSISDKTEKQMFDTMRELICQTLNNPELKFAKRTAKKYADSRTVDIIPTGFKGLDKRIQGFARGELALIAAHPGMGKTAFMLSLAHNLSVNSHTKVAIFSLERDGVQLANRLIERETGLSVTKIKKDKNYAEAGIDEKIIKLAGSSLIVDAPKILTLDVLKSKCRYLVEQERAELVLIDAMELVVDRGSSDNLLRELKSIAVELHIPIIIFGKLGRVTETEDKAKRPSLEDLGKGIVTSVDTIMFIYRPEYYLIHNDAEGNSLHGRAEIVVAKHISEVEHVVQLQYCEKYSSFIDVE